MAPNDTRTVAILSDNPETIDGLVGYLRNVGIPAQGRRDLDVARLQTSKTRAIVLFPDDFAEAGVTALLNTLMKKDDTFLKLIVTGKPAPYEALLVGRKGFVVNTRPVWGWAIVDAIRAHEDSGT